MNVNREKRRVPRARLGIRPRLLVAMAALSLLFMVVLWVFQIRMLGYFYEREKFEEMDTIAVELAQELDSADFELQVQDHAQSKGACIRVFRIKDAENGQREARMIADANVAADCLIHHLPSEGLSLIYEETKAGGGVYDKRLEFQEDLSPSEDEEFHLPGFHRRGGSINAVHARQLYRDGAEYLLLLDMQLSPVKAVINTLEAQFYWISVALLIGTFLVSFLASRMIAKPLITITQRARRLADGAYDTDFTTRGYREVQELAEALNYAAEEIGATDRLQKELIANISHDLRTPLTMIKGYSEMMRDIPGENTPENIQAVIDETTRLSELVSDLMDLSKLRVGTSKPQFTVFDLTATVRDTMQRYETLIRHEGYCIEFCAEGKALVMADRTMILQVIYNLINNAVNYTGESRRVTVTQTVTQGRVRLSVTDDGEGIAPESIPEIWDRYYRVDRVHKRAVMGTGLGLSIVKGVLEAHNATYGVDSAVGVGSVFWFELPLAEPSDGEGA